jgi:hypothetical protein
MANISKKPLNSVIVQAIKFNMGFMGNTADALGVHRSTLNGWIREDEQLQEEIAHQLLDNIELSESKLFKRIVGFTETLKTTVTRADGKKEVQEREVYYPPAESSIQFHLKTKGKDEGYNQTLSVRHSIDKDFDQEEREKRIAALEQKLLDNE